MKPLRVLIADDAVVVRRLLTSVIDEDPELEVVGVAANGAIAVSKAQQLRPDVITLDIEMPDMDGLQALAAIRKFDRNVPIIMFSTLTERGAASTLEALSLGASDYVTKPANVGSVTAALGRVREDLVPKIKALCRRAPAPPAPSAAPVHAGTSTSLFKPVTTGVAASPSPIGARRSDTIDVVVIGASTGGPVALSTVLTALPAELAVPVVVTQHMPPVFTRLLSQRIDAAAAINVREAVDGDVLEPGVALIAPGDFHMMVHRGATNVSVRLDSGAPVNFCRPSVDVMFESIANVYAGNVLSVMLTGMGHDGRDGTSTLRSKGATVIAQDEATSVVWGMPGAVVQSKLADHVLPLSEIGPRIARLVAERSRPTVRIR